jgi:hypothetical protein
VVNAGVCYDRSMVGMEFRAGPPKVLEAVIRTTHACTNEKWTLSPTLVLASSLLPRHYTTNKHDKPFTKTREIDTWIETCEKFECIFEYEMQL